MADERQKVWNSLEVAKLIVDASVPLVIAIAGGLAAMITDQRRLEDRQLAAQQRHDQEEAQRARDEIERDAGRVAATEQKRTEQAIALRTKYWERIAEPLNDIYAYFLRVGPWKELSAHQILQRKRFSDKVFRAYQPVFTPEFVAAYKAFMHATFVESGDGADPDAPLRTSGSDRPGDHAGAATFKPELEDRAKVAGAYKDLLDAVATDLDLPHVDLSLPASDGGMAAGP